MRGRESSQIESGFLTETLLKDDMKGENNHFEEFDHVDLNDMYPCRFCLNLRRSSLFVNKYII